MLTRQAAAAVSVGTYWAWETTATLRLLSGARHFGAHRRRRAAGAYRGGRPRLQPVYLGRSAAAQNRQVCGHNVGRRMVVAKRSNCM